MPIIRPIIALIEENSGKFVRCKHLRRAAGGLPKLKPRFTDVITNTSKIARERVLLNFCERQNAKILKPRHKVSPEVVNDEFSRISKHLDSTEQEQLLRLIDEDKVLLWKRPTFMDSDVLYTFGKVDAPLNIWLKEEAQMPLFKELLQMERSGKIDGKNVGRILRLSQDSGIGVECPEALFTEFMKALRNGQLNSSEKLALAMQRCYEGTGLNFLRVLPKVNKVNQAASNKFLNNFENIEQVFKNGKTIDELKAAGGIKLKYSRTDLKENIMKQIEHLPMAEQEQILSKFGLQGDRNIMSGMPVFSRDAAGLNEIEKSINSEIGKFLHGNEIILPQGFENYRTALNEITETFPEFLFTVGLKQHNAQEHFLAEHMLKVFQENMKNPLYKTLNATDRRVLGISSLLHDIKKVEKVKCPGHAFDCSLSVDAIIGRMDLSVAEKNRIINFVENHHWLEKISTGENFDKLLVQEMAEIFKSGNDFTMARIFAESDLKAVNKTFSQLFGGKLKSPVIEAIENDIKVIQANGRMVYTADVTTKNAIASGAKSVKLGSGEEMTENLVIDAEQLGLNESAFGYHASDSKGLINVYGYGRYGVDGAFSLSVGKNGAVQTYYNLPDFLISRRLDMDNIGYMRPCTSNTKYLKNKDSINAYLRSDTHFSRGLKNKYFKLTSKNITNKQYAQLFREIPRDNPHNIHSNQKVIEILGGEKEAMAFENSVIEQNGVYTAGKTFSEAVAIDLEWGALGTKRSNLNELPYDLRKFAQDNNLVIVKVK